MADFQLMSDLFLFGGGAPKAIGEGHDMGPLISAGQLDKVEGLCRVGVYEGALLASGGSPTHIASARTGNDVLSVALWQPSRWAEDCDIMRVGQEPAGQVFVSDPTGPCPDSEPKKHNEASSEPILKLKPRAAGLTREAIHRSPSIRKKN